MHAERTLVIATLATATGMLAWLAWPTSVPVRAPHTSCPIPETNGLCIRFEPMVLRPGRCHETRARIVAVPRDAALAGFDRAGAPHFAFDADLERFLAEPRGLETALARWYVLASWYRDLESRDPERMLAASSRSSEVYLALANETDDVAVPAAVRKLGPDAVDAYCDTMLSDGPAELARTTLDRCIERAHDVGLTAATSPSYAACLHDRRELEGP